MPQKRKAPPRSAPPLPASPPTRTPPISPTRQPPSLERARYYAILDSGYVPAERWVETYGALVRGGAHLVQIRAKGEASAQRRSLLERILERRQDDPGRYPPLVLNDDLELCLDYPGLGLHVGQDDTPAEEARRRLGPERLLGLSTHSIAQARAAMALGPAVLSYFAVGPVFATPTKPDYDPVGLGLVREVAAARPALPFFCIGGVKRTNLARVLEAGARRVVTVSDVLQAPDPAAAAAETVRLLESGRR